MHLVMIGGSDAGISAALRAGELDPSADVTVVLEDAYPNFSICGIPYYLSGEVTPWRNLAHRTVADLEAARMRLRLDTTARRIDVPGHKLLITTANGGEEVLSYDKLIVGTGAVPVRPPISGLAGHAALGPGDGVHLLHSMGNTFAVMATLEQAVPASAVIVGAGYIGLEMADALTVRGLQVTQMEQLPEVLPTVDPEVGALDQGADFGVDGGQHLGQLLHLGHLQPADGQRVGHFQADVPGADDDRAGRGGLLQGGHDGEGVAHRVQQVHPVIRAEPAGAGQPGDRGADRDRAGTDDELVIAEYFLAAARGGDQELAAGHVDA